MFVASCLAMKPFSRITAVNSMVSPPAYVHVCTFAYHSLSMTSFAGSGCEAACGVDYQCGVHGGRLDQQTKFSCQCKEGFTYLSNGNCVPNCPTGYQLDAWGVRWLACPSGKVIVDYSTCVEKCVSGYVNTLQGCEGLLFDCCGSFLT